MKLVVKVVLFIASLFFNFVPVFAAITAFAYGQQVTALQVLGMVIVIAGLLIPRLVKWQQQRLTVRNV